MVQLLIHMLDCNPDGAFQIGVESLLLFWSTLSERMLWRSLKWHETQSGTLVKILTQCLEFFRNKPCSRRELACGLRLNTQESTIPQTATWRLQCQSNVASNTNNVLSCLVSWRSTLFRCGDHSNVLSTQNGCVIEWKRKTNCYHCDSNRGPCLQFGISRPVEANRQLKDRWLIQADRRGFPGNAGPQRRRQPIARATTVSSLCKFLKVEVSEASDVFSLLRN